MFKSTAVIAGLLSLAVPSLALAKAKAIPQADANSQQCPMSTEHGPNIMVSNVEIPSNPPRTEAIGWIWGYNWCSKGNKISDTPDICNPSTNRAVEFKHVPFTDKFGTLDWSCYANVNVYFYGCQYNPDGTVDYDNVRANFVSQTEGGMFPQQQQDYDCTYDTENRACPYNPGYGTQTEYEGFMSCGVQGSP